MLALTESSDEGPSGFNRKKQALMFVVVLYLDMRSLGGKMSTLTCKKQHVGGPLHSYGALLKSSGFCKNIRVHRVAEACGSGTSLGLRRAGVNNLLCHRLTV